MAIASGIIVGLLILSAGGVLSFLLGTFLVALANEIGKDYLHKVSPHKYGGLIAGGVLSVGLLLWCAGPLASLWGGIAAAVSIIGG